MAGASDYTEENILKALLIGTAFPLPTGTYVSLHTADPGDTGANEVSLVAWPAYVRKHAEAGGAIGTGWAAPSTSGVSKISTNLNQIPYPSNNGASTVTVTHFAIWDAVTAGNCLGSAALSTPQAITTAGVLIFDVGSLTVSAT